MANYIDKNELLHAIDKRNGRLPLWLDEILMQDCKVADVAPVVHGQWFGTVCTACGESTSFYYDCAYCPQCGAEMDEVSGDE